MGEAIERLFDAAPTMPPLFEPITGQLNSRLLVDGTGARGVPCVQSYLNSLGLRVAGNGILEGVETAADDSPIDLQQVNDAYVDIPVVFAASERDVYNSYSGKHALEDVRRLVFKRAGNNYVSNGAFIVACIERGFSFQYATEFGTKNLMFNMELNHVFSEALRGENIIA